jgi:exodeoxyribonuclease VII small subunit
MPSPKKPTQKSAGKMTFEEATEELESIIERIEQGEVGLEAALAARKRGDALIKRCREILDTAEQELEKVVEEEGT